ncbi:kinase-like domain-containing protein [Gigaspora rosea]|uniref:1-phosphatidylinositol 4-kinase n=1 Tax=Gigaspora rosea TaxID=44941 RepID=A0A397U2W7_9GLOM|nr:kinase-like domain-containing protein [Gigaspora rosea]
MSQLLLRLFQSEHFNSWMAISYLFRYPDSVGIQHYLCNELKKFPMSEIEFFLPQLCHLLISRPTESVALEYFILENCEKSTHMAILTLWYLQAYRSDLSANPSSPAFTVCKRVLNKCQEIVFKEERDENDKITATGLRGMFPRQVRENTYPALVGMGAMLAGIAAPMLTRSAGQIAIAQGRRTRTFSNVSDKKLKEELHYVNKCDELVSTKDILVTEDNKDEVHVIKDEDASNINGQSKPKFIKGHKKSLSRSTSSSLPHRHNGLGNPMFTSPSLDDLQKGNVFSMKQYLSKNSKPRPQSADYPLSSVEQDGDDDDDEISLFRRSTEILDHTLLDELEEHSPEWRRRLLKGNYFQSEPQFLLTLQDISTRLIIVPREARQSTLRAELTLLNHNLPAEICIPLWCPATAENPCHHRVVRISPAEAVVLNSAERVPYLLMVEVLEGETNYDLSKMQAQKSLNRLLHDEKRKKGSTDTSILTDIPKNEDNISKLTIEHSEESTDSLGSVNKPNTERFHDKLKDTSNSNYIIGEKVIENECNSTNKSDNIKTDDVGEPPLIAKISAPPRSLSITRSSRRTASIDRLPPLVSVDEKGAQPLVIEPLPQTIDTLSQSNDMTSVPYTPTTPTLPESNSQYFKQVINRRQSNSADEFAERMRTAAVMLAQLNAAQQVRTSSTGETIQRTRADTEAIRKKIISEMMGLEEERMLKITTQGVTSVVGNGGEGGGGEMLEDERRVLIAVNKDDPSAAVFSEEWETKKERIRKSSPFGSLSNWRLLSVIVKTGADLRQEQLACQLIREMQRIWQKAGINVWVRYYRVLVTSDNSGLIETIQNTISIHSIKKDAYAKRLNEKGFMFTLFDYFVKTYGDVSSEKFLRAQDNFMRSLAAYSLVCYILQVKDRHNGNVLLDTEGHLIHIDFGFMLSNSPGSVGFELAPFKLSQEYLDILGGVTSEKFAEFKTLLKQAFLELRRHADNFILLVEMMSKDSKLPCFLAGSVSNLHDRFQLSLTEPQFDEFVEKLIMSSCCNVFTRLYDTFQYYSNGIL